MLSDKQLLTENPRQFINAYKSLNTILNSNKNFLKIDDNAKIA